MQRPIKGFTLIEISVVLLIIGLIGLLIFPKLGDRLWDTEYKISLRRLAGSVKEVFNLAATKGVTYYFVFDLDKEKYWVAIPDQQGRLSEEVEAHMLDHKMPDGTDIVDIAFGSRVFSEGQNIILFTPTGLEGKYYIHLERKKEKLTLILSPLTGGTEIKDGYITP